MPLKSTSCQTGRAVREADGGERHVRSSKTERSCTSCTISAKHKQAFSLSLFPSPFPPTSRRGSGKHSDRGGSSRLLRAFPHLQCSQKC